MYYIIITLLLVSYLLVLRDKVVHVALSLSELHLVHALSGVPMEESLTSEHGGKLLADALEQLLDGGAVADEGGGHLETSRRDVTDSTLDVVGDPLDEVATVLVLYVQHLLVYLRCISSFVMELIGAVHIVCKFVFLNPCAKC